MVRTFRSPSIHTPGAAERNLSPGKWFIFERTVTAHGGGALAYTPNDAAVLRPTDVAVTGPDGVEVPVSAVTTKETIKKGSRGYKAGLKFTGTLAGTKTGGTQGPDAEIIVVRSLGDSFREVVSLVWVGAAGGFLIAAGVVLFLVGSRRDGRASTPALGARPG